MAQIIDGKKIAEKIKDDIVKEVRQLPGRPSLAIILIGHRADSELYVSLKEKEAKKCGLDTHLYKFEEDSSEQDILDTIAFLNQDDSIDGILLQLPLPQQFNVQKIVKSIDPNKDIDGFHPDNLKKITSNPAHDCVMPPLANVIIKMLEEYNIALKDKKVAIIAHSDIFTQGIGDILAGLGAKIKSCRYGKDKKSEIQSLSKIADIVITAVGKKKYLNKNYLKQGAVVIDIGIIKDGPKTYGDVDFNDVKDIASYITPVPGGVGPMTIACAFQNVLKFYKTKTRI